MAGYMSLTKIMFVSHFYRTAIPVPCFSRFLPSLRQTYPFFTDSKTQQSPFFTDSKFPPKKILLALPNDRPIVTPLDHTTTTTSTLSNVSTTTRQSNVSRNKLILIDGNAVLYRAYYKLMAKMQHENFGDAYGESDWVLTVFTALSTIMKIFELVPSHIAVIFDHEGLTFRHTLFSEYKMNRMPTPEAVTQALQYVKPALVSMGLKTIQVPGVEADDVIGTLGVGAVKAGFQVRVLSPDKDFFQILSPSLRLLRFVPRGSGIVSFGLENFHERFGNLQPSQFVDILALIGDKIDNIPGVAGIGEKTAIKLIQEYGSLEKLFEERAQVKGKRALNGLLADNGRVFLGKRLVTLRTDLPDYMVPFSMDDLLYKKPQDGGERYFNLLKAMGSFVDGPFEDDLRNDADNVFLKYK